MAWRGGALFLVYAASAAGVTPPCGTILTADTTLDADMACSSTALEFRGPASNNLALDCAGHSIVTSSGHGIFAVNVSGIRISNCNIVTSGDFDDAIVLQQGVTLSTITANVISTSGRGSRGIDLEQSSDNELSGNFVQALGSGANALRIRSAANGNRVSQNTLLSVATAIDIQSSSNTDLVDNSIVSQQGTLTNHNLLLGRGGLAVDGGGIIYAVENSLGSSSGLGTATAFFRVDPATGEASSVMPLTAAAADLGFGFSSLEVLPDGRIFALADAGAPAALYEIDPVLGEVTAHALNLPPLSGMPNGLESMSNSQLLATTDAGELLEIDVDSGDATLIGQQAIGWQDLAVHPASARVYAISHRESEATGSSHLYEIDAADGQVIAEIGDLEHRFMSDLDFAGDGTLYANNGGQLIVIDPASGANFQLNRFGPDPLEPLSRNTRMDGNLIQFVSGNLRFTVPIILPDAVETRLSTEFIDIDFNRVMVDSATLPFLDVPARINLSDLPGTTPTLLVDEVDNGSFTVCPPDRCTLLFFSSGVLSFDVTGFTTYSSLLNIGSTTSETEDSSGSALSPWLLLLLALAAGSRRVRGLRGRRIRANPGRR